MRSVFEVLLVSWLLGLIWGGAALALFIRRFIQGISIKHGNLTYYAGQ